MVNIDLSDLEADRESEGLGSHIIAANPLSDSDRTLRKRRL